MKVSRKIAIPIILNSLILSLVAQELFMAPGLGINMAVVTLLTAIITGYLIKREVLETKMPAWMIIAPMLVASYGFAIPDSDGLDGLNLAVLALVLGLISMIHASPAVLSVAKTVLLVPFRWMAIPFLGLFGTAYVDWKEDTQKKTHTKGIVLGAIYSLPALLIFGVILSNADPMFGQLLSLNVDTSPEEYIQRIFLFGLTACTSIGLFVSLCPKWMKAVARGLGYDASQVKPIFVYAQGSVHELYGPNKPPEEFVKEAQTSEHVTIFSTFLGCISGLFALFMVVQIRYLFGGSEVVLKTANLTYAQYARQGFLEIFSVTCLTIPMLLVGQGLFEKMEQDKRKSITLFAGIVSSLLVLLLLSSAYRLFLYVDAYGMSTLRFYTAAGILWLAVVIGSYFTLGLKWQLVKVGYASFIGLVGVVMICNIVKPDSVIAKISINRPLNKGFDDVMVSQLGADAYPVIMRLGDKKLQENWRAQFSQQNRNWKSSTLSELQVR